ncbi:MAG: YihY/virulence factor BrkB family protein [Parachlamydiales bacterium]|nr:YihY/virulence factor BrkB family protein [Parachlamydiales bacterium]
MFLLLRRAIKGFIKNQCNLRSASLTFFTLLTIVPLVAILFAIAQQVGVQEMVQKELTERFEEQQEIVQEIVGLANNLLLETKGGWIASFGVLFLLWSVFQLFRHIENALNHIWGESNKKNLLKRIGNFLIVLAIIPLFFLVSGFIKIMFVNYLIDYLIFHGYWGMVLIFIVKLFPIIFITGLFAFIYYLVPHGKVSKRAAVFGGFFAAICYQILQLAYIHFQMRAARLGMIYGSFVALPLFLIWLHLSWQVFLLGAEVVYEKQIAKRA